LPQRRVWRLTGQPKTLFGIVALAALRCVKREDTEQLRSGPCLQFSGIQIYSLLKKTINKGDDWVSGWKELLTQAGYRVTEPRCAVMQLLLDSGMPLSPQALFESSRTQRQNLGLVTIYRTLELFEALGLVCRVHLKDGCHGYLPVSPGHHHFVICEHCGVAVEFPGGDDLRMLIADIEAQTGYRVAEHLLQLIGLCPVCKAK